MPFTKQTLHSMHVESVKGLRDLTINFDPEKSMVTGIFGPNGCGKSTLLHLLACSFKPSADHGGDDRKLSHFFLPTTGNFWSGSAFSVQYTQEEVMRGRPPVPQSGDKKFEKKTGRWAPRYDSRDQRHCRYLGISTCVPRIETETKISRVDFIATQPQSENAVLVAARYILNRNYSSYLKHAAKGGAQYIGVTIPSGSSDTERGYTELSMGAGEQRVFKILEAVHAAEKYSLILIDEIDLLLHEQSLTRLAEHLRDYCKQKSIQLIFTAHRHSLLSVPGLNFRHIMRTPQRDFCLDRTTPDALSQLSDRPIRPIRIFVEDDLAEALVNKILERLSARRYATIARYGSILNAFTLAGAAVLNGDLTEDHIFVLDGDSEFREHDARESRMRTVIAGDDPAIRAKAARALEGICQFKLPAATKPETYIWGVLRDQNPIAHAEGGQDVIRAAAEIVVVPDSHEYVSSILRRAGYERTIGLTRVVDALAATAAWPDYVAEIDARLRARLKVYEATAVSRGAAATREPTVERVVG